MLISDTTLISEYKKWHQKEKIANQVLARLQAAKLDLYNHQYVFRFTITQVDEITEDNDNDEGGD